MGGHHRRRVLVAAVLVTLAVLAGCSSDDAGDGEEAVTFTARAPEEIAPPPAEGNGIVLPQPASAMPDRYVQEEFLVAGTATRFDAVLGSTAGTGHAGSSNKSALDYRREAALFPRVSRPIIDAHSHIMGREAAGVYVDAARTFGVRLSSYFGS